MNADEPDQWLRFIQGLRDGNRTILFEFCASYGPQLNRLADKYLGAQVRRRVGAEDVVQSACRTFFRRAQGGEFQLSDSEALWRLLCAITLTKVREHSRFHSRQKRGLDREASLTPNAGDSAAHFDPRDPQPTPAETAEFSDFFETIRAGLDDEERQILDLKLQDCTNDEVASQLGLSERTVRRTVKRLQGRLTRALEESGS
jgi:RNA polymerase sigma factor (sigma-70 family)